MKIKPVLKLYLGEIEESSADLIKGWVKFRRGKTAEAIAKINQSGL